MKSALAVIAGLIVGVIVIMIVEAIGHMIYPPPEGVDLKDPAQLAAIMDSIPLGAKIAVLVAWGLGIFAGGVTAVKISGGKTWPAKAIAAILFAGAIATMFMIPHPVWMIAGAVVVTLLGLFGATRFARA